MKFFRIFVACLLVCVLISTPNLKAESEPEIIEVAKIWQLDSEYSILGYHDVFVFCSIATDDGIILSKMDVRSGELVWETETEYTNYKPVFSQNGYVVLFDEDSKLICFDDNGTEVWKTEITDTQYKYESGISMKIIEDEIFISKYGKESHKEGSIIESNLYAIDIFAGEHVWSKVSDKPITECFAKTSEYTFWGGGKTLYSFGEGGETAWEDYKHCDVVSNTPDNCVKGDYLFFGSFT